MVFSLKDSYGYSIGVKEGECGKVEQFYFDDEKWTVRYVVVDVGSWYDRIKVLLSPLSIQKVDLLNRGVITNFTRDELLKSPDIDTDKAISRQMEMRYLDHYKWPYYWTGAGTWGTAATFEGGMEIPPSFRGTERSLEATPKNQEESAIHLRSAKDIFGYHVEGIDAEFGRVDDLLVDTSTWVIRYLVIHLRKWLPSSAALISREWVDSISWRQKKVRVSIFQDEILRSPEFRPGVQVSREYEELLHRYYGRERYWERGEPKSAA